MLDGLPHCIDLHITTLMRHLGGDDQDFFLLRPLADLRLKSMVTVIRHAAHTKTFQNDRVIVLFQIIKDGRIDPRYHFQDKYPRRKIMVKNRIALRLWLLDIKDQSVIAKDGDLWIINAGKSIITFCPGFSCPRSQDDLVIKDHMHTACTVIRRIDKSIEQVVSRIRILRRDRHLGSRNNDRLSAVLDKIGQGCRCISQRMRSMRHDKAIVSRIIFLDTGNQCLPMLGIDIGAVNIK